MKLTRPTKTAAALLLTPLLLALAWTYYPQPTPQSPQQLLNITLPLHTSDPKLQQKLDPNFQNASAHQIIRWLNQQTNAQFHFHDSTTPYETQLNSPHINLTLNNVTAEQILDYTLLQTTPDTQFDTSFPNSTTIIHLATEKPHTLTLTYDVRRLCDDLAEHFNTNTPSPIPATNNTLPTTTKESAISSTDTTFTELLSTNAPKSPQEVSAALANIIRKKIAPQDWQSNGGHSYTLNPTQYTWQVSASPESHHQITNLLYNLWTTLHPTSPNPTPH